MNTLDPAISACAYYFGVRQSDIMTIAIEYQEFKDHRHAHSVEKAEAAIIKLARDLAAQHSIVQAVVD